MSTEKRLRAKGWPESEIKKLSSTVGAQFGKGLNRVLFMTALVVITLCLIGVSLFLIPFFVVVGNNYIFLFVVLLGLIFGTLFNFIIQDIEHLEPKHHWFAGIFIPVIAIIALTISVYAANKVEEILGFTLRQNPWTVSAAFVLVFMLPFIISSIKKKSL